MKVSWDDDILQLVNSTCHPPVRSWHQLVSLWHPWLSERALLLGVSHGGCWLTAVVIKHRCAVHLTCIWGTVLHHIIFLWRLSCNWLWVCPIAPCAAATLAAERYALGPGGAAWGSRWRWLDPQSLLVSWIGRSTSFYLLDLLDLLAELFGVFFFLHFRWYDLNLYLAILAHSEVSTCPQRKTSRTSQPGMEVRGHGGATHVRCVGMSVGRQWRRGATVPRS